MVSARAEPSGLIQNETLPARGIAPRAAAIPLPLRGSFEGVSGLLSPVI
jgi:hypothetical protein